MNNDENNQTIDRHDFNMSYVIFKSGGECTQFNKLPKHTKNDIIHRRNYNNISYIGELKKDKKNKVIFPYTYHGKGFLFFKDADKLCCQSHFFEGKRHGETIEYDRDSYLLFRGNYYKGKKIGHGKIFFPGLHKVYLSGTFENNKLSGLGVEYDFDELTNKYYCKYVGSFRNNKYDGYGLIYSSKGFKLYEGSFSNGVLHGKKAIQYITNTPYILYIGEYKNGDANGQGEIYTIEDSKHYLYYRGQFVRGCASGKGELYDCNCNLLYTGDFRKSQPHGIGTMFSISNNLIEYEGEIRNGYRHGKGIAFVYEPETNVTRSKYDGFFRNNKMHGKGEKTLYKYDASSDTVTKYCRLVGTFSNGSFLEGTHFVCEMDEETNEEHWLPFYSGSFYQTKDGYLEKHGTGLLYEIECVSSGSFWKNEKHGTISEFDVKTNQLLFEGTYVNGKRHGVGNVYNPRTREYDKLEYINGLTMKEHDMKFETVLNSYVEQNQSKSLKKKLMKFDKRLFSRYMKKNNIRYHTTKKQHKRTMFGKIQMYKHIKKSIANRKNRLSDSISLKILRDYVESQYSSNVSSFTGFKRKSTLWKSILSHEYPDTEEDDDTEEEDLFGYPIINRCVGSDDLFYDKRSMDLLFEKNSEGDYLRISYCYDENNNRLPSYPVSSNGKVLSSFRMV